MLHETIVVGARQAARRGPIVAAERCFILDVGVSAIGIDSALTIIEGWIKDRRRHYVCITGAHGIIESRKDPALLDIHNRAGLVAADGMPLVFMARWLGYKNTSRIYGPDLMRRLSELSAIKGYRQFYYGGGRRLAQRLKEQLQSQLPSLPVVGVFSPPFGEMTSAEDDAIVDIINASKADIVWVGLSTPKQERWMAAHVNRLDAPVLIGVGAAFDFLAGTKRQAPKWMQRTALEWLFRLGCEPRRLWRRYARVVPQFIFLAALQILLRRPPQSS